MEYDRTMTDKKVHKTHFSQDKEMPWKRPITIAYIAGTGYRCGVEGCENEAGYMAEGRMYCTFHWISKKEE